MVWTAPMTFAPNQVLTAAQLNTMLRDNMLETAPGKASGTSGYFVATGRGSIAQRVPVTARVATVETTDSTDYTDLTTPGPSVTTTTGTRALVFVYSRIENNTTNASCIIGVEVTGASSLAANVNQGMKLDGTNGGQHMRFANGDLFDELTPGENIFTCKYKVGSNTGTFGDRFIAVLPL